ncbi:large ribosomal subunit protein mL37 [Poecilia reticulata]|uniref:Large ribosomal subunit protein mL37 n=1 Tax=Poecilia reticulata TaxID=8081 RepID=A0A3P9P1M1_POERE|nr:PREDICTED: 39S ribosomal protein L37, mitochondrial [Poecilia reticulata]
MLPEATRYLKATVSLFSPNVFLNASKLSAHGAPSSLQTRRNLRVSRCLAARIPPQKKPREKVEIPGLDMVTYGDRMHYVPGLAKPVFPPWEMSFKDPRYYRSPPAQEMALYKDKPCYVFNQRTSILEGVRQAAWLTKTHVRPGPLPHLISLAAKPENQLPDQDERVQNAIKHSRFWDTTEPRPRKEKYSNTLLLNLLHLCGSLQLTHPAVGRRILAENYSLAATWKRGEDLFQIRGRNGLLHCSMDPLPRICGEQEVLETSDQVLESFYPVSPTIDLQQVSVYKEEMNCTGFKGEYPYPHAHTLYFLETSDPNCQLHPEQFRAKMIMFTFGNALARAHKLYGTQPQSLLERPITVQAVGTNGRIFQFLVFQLNTTDLSGDDGIKNQAWLDEDVELYDFAKVRPFIKRKEVKVPAGLAGYKPETFSKFLALFLHGAA